MGYSFVRHPHGLLLDVSVKKQDVFAYYEYLQLLASYIRLACSVSSCDVRTVRGVINVIAHLLSKKPPCESTPRTRVRRTQLSETDGRSHMLETQGGNLCQSGDEFGQEQT